MLPDLFSIADLFWAPFAFTIMFFFLRAILHNYPEREKRIFQKAFFFKMFATTIFTILIATYYHGDTEMFYQGTLDIHKSLMENKFDLWEVITSMEMTKENSFYSYVYYDNSWYPVSAALAGASNYFVTKAAVIPSLIFQKSYIAICFCFAFFAFWGSVRLFKFFYYFFPNRFYEVALATLFLPSVVFWSSGMLKDTICFGSVGYLLYAVLSMVERKKNFVSSALWILISIHFLFYIKVYILLALAPGIATWLFLKVTKSVSDTTLKRILGFLMIAVSSLVGVWLINYITSSEVGKSFQLDNVIESSNYQRGLYNNMSTYDQGSYFSAGGGSNPIVNFLMGIIATLFRPFPWEISSPMVLLSAIESFIFLVLTFITIRDAGVKRFFSEIFSNTQLLMCFMFAIVFAGAVGSTALNFGSLSRYKIPCMPFYLLMILLVMRQANVRYPKWLNGIFKFVFK